MSKLVFRRAVAIALLSGVISSSTLSSEEERAVAGISEGLVRYSTGIENSVDLIADLDQALGIQGV